VGDGSRGRYATPADFPRHGGTPYRGLRVRRFAWGLSIVQGPFSVAPCPNPNITIRNFCIAVRPCFGTPQAASLTPLSGRATVSLHALSRDTNRRPVAERRGRRGLAHLAPPAAAHTPRSSAAVSWQWRRRNPSVPVSAAPCTPRQSTSVRTTTSPAVPAAGVDPVGCHAAAIEFVGGFQSDCIGP
jgi:hypothetical protein